MKPSFIWKEEQCSKQGSDWKPTTDHLQNQIDGIEHDLTDIKHNIQTWYDGEFTTLKNDEKMLGQQVQQIQEGVNELKANLVPRDEILTTNTAQTITATKTLNADTNIASGKKLIFKGNRDWNVENNNGFVNFNSAWGILFDRTRNANKTSILNDHIETPYINIGSGDNARYRLAKSGDNLTWDGKVVVTQNQLVEILTNFVKTYNLEPSNEVSVLVEEE